MQWFYNKQENLEKVNEKSVDEEEKEELQVCWKLKMSNFHQVLYKLNLSKTCNSKFSTELQRQKLNCRQANLQTRNKLKTYWSTVLKICNSIQPTSKHTSNVIQKLFILYLLTFFLRQSKVGIEKFPTIIRKISIQYFTSLLKYIIASNLIELLKKFQSFAASAHPRRDDLKPH